MDETISLMEFLAMNDWSFEDVKLFLEHDASSINEPDAIGDTPLFEILASSKCSLDIVTLLLEFGASTNSRNNDGETPLSYSVQYIEDQAVLNLLIEKTSNVNVRDELGHSILCHALFAHHPIKLIESLLMKAGSVQACLIHATVWQCFLRECRWRSISYETTEFSAVLKLLIETGFDVTKVDPDDGRSLLCLALISRAEEDMIKVLLNKGCSFDDCMEHRSPMMCVTDGCTNVVLKTEVMTLLLNMGASLEEVDKAGYTVLQRALKYCVLEDDAFKILFDCARMKNELPNIKNKELGNLLHFAVGNLYCEINVVKELLQSGVRCDEINLNGRFPLHEALESGNNDYCIISTLLRSGTPVNMKCKDGDTPLMLAVTYTRPINVIFALLAAGSFIEGLTDHRGVPLLEKVLKYEGLGINTCKTVIKFAFIRNPNFQIEGLIESHADKENLTSFAEECRIDLRRMGSVNIGQRTSIAFIKRYYSLNVGVMGVRKTTLHLQLDQLLKAISDRRFYNFLDVISYKICTLLLIEKLQQLSVYTMSNCCDDPCEEHKTVLTTDCLEKIAKYVTKQDLLSLILAFYFTCDFVHND